MLTSDCNFWQNCRCIRKVVYDVTSATMFDVFQVITSVLRLTPKINVYHYIFYKEEVEKYLIAGFEEEEYHLRYLKNREGVSV